MVVEVTHGCPQQARDALNSPPSTETATRHHTRGRSRVPIESRSRGPPRPSARA
ncbi:hypothetical protein [Streptomyces aureus]|uniref:hypothetical protein n=1 Tax=Streptomyces aureus TaxID=193461 RepID=UPI0020B16A9F|nr:hypothetical protein [Streptomyces aureus]